MKKLYKIYMVICAIALLFSVLAEIEKQQVVQNTQTFCDATTGGCNTVQSSEYAQVLGIDVAIIGIIAFSALTILVLIQFRKENKYRLYMIYAATFIAGFGALFLIYLQAYVINAWCVYCLFVDGSSIALLGITIYTCIKG